MERRRVEIKDLVVGTDYYIQSTVGTDIADVNKSSKIGTFEKKIEYIYPNYQESAFFNNIREIDTNNPIQPDEVFHSDCMLFDGPGYYISTPFYFYSIESNTTNKSNLNPNAEEFIPRISHVNLVSKTGKI
jgi:hypothetical protein